jgi:DNA-binding CsgD family transcriptional regulator
MKNKKSSERADNPVLGGSGSDPPRSRDLPAKSLSRREREVIVLLAEGNSNKQIAAVLNLSSRTVETYRARAMRRLELRSFPELVRYAVRHGVLQSQELVKTDPGNKDQEAARTQPAIEPSGHWQDVLKMSGEFQELRSAFKAVQKRFEKAKTSDQRRKLLAGARQILLRAHLLAAKLKAKASAKESLS